MKQILISMLLLAGIGQTVQAQQTDVRTEAPQAEQVVTGYYNVGEVPAGTPNEEVFRTIIRHYEGKVVLVDFWATWCGPCRMANRLIAPMKSELKEKEIVYLYLTGETSPLATWEGMIPDIHGDHYRVTNAQWKYLCDYYQIEGVPTYLIVDRKGKIRLKQTGFPGADKLKAALLQVTDEER